MPYQAPLAPPDPGRPRLEASHGVGPGPLSPAWPKPVMPPPPVNEWEALARTLEAIQDEVSWALRPHDRLPFFLTIEQRRTIEAAALALKRANREVLGPTRWREVEEWPTPVLPATTLIGARDVRAVLSTAILLATHLVTRIHHPWPRA